MNLRAGQRLHSAVSAAQLVVVRAPDADIDLRCGGAPLLEEPRTSETTTANEPSGETLLIGKRYADEDLGLELLCTRAGDGTLTVDGRGLGLKGAKPLPSSD
jgi:hypothetical protein